MKLSKERVHLLAATVLDSLEQHGQLVVQGRKPALLSALERAIADELEVEDRLNAEVREVLKQYQGEMERGGADYQKMFRMIKAKLVNERGLIL